MRAVLTEAGFTPEDWAAAERAAAAQLARNAAWEGKTEGTVVLGPESTWSLDGSERGGDYGYRCSTCRDSGWVRREAQMGTSEFGQPYRCACQDTNPLVIRERQERRIARSGLAVELSRCTLDNFQRLDGTHKTVDALRSVLEAHRTRDERGRWLVLTGGPGRGKTHLLAALVPVAALLDDVRWANVPDLLAAMAEDSFARADQFTALTMSAPILILDEFGAAGTSDWARERLERILNQRYATQATTVVGLTVPMKAVEDWSPRIASRLGDVRLSRRLELTCGDYRKRVEAA